MELLNQIVFGTFVGGYIGMFSRYLLFNEIPILSIYDMICYASISGVIGTNLAKLINKLQS